MPVRFPRLLPAVLIVGVSCVWIGGCSDDSDEPPPLTAPTVVETMRSLAVEPPVVAPAFLDPGGCPGFPPFETRFAILMRTSSRLFLRRVGVQFVDGYGARSVPMLIPTTPSTPAIPIPTPSNAVVIPAGTSRLPFAVRFGCGVRPAGILLIEMDTVDASGATDTSRVSVRVG